MASEMTCNVSQAWNPKLPKGLGLEITHHPQTMKRIANLIIAVERLKSSKMESVLSSPCMDKNLLNIVFESVMEEEIVYECYSTPESNYCKLSEHECSITDSEKRGFVLLEDTMELHAVMLQGGAADRKVNLNMSTYVHPTTPSPGARTVALGIKGTNLYLSCRKNGSEPTLHLEEVENKENLKTITPGSDMVRFLFYKQDTELNISTLTSVPHSNWYISTAEEDNMPVEMCQETARRYRSFNIKRRS